MEQFNLLDKLDFHEPDPYAQPLYVDKDTRIFRFMLKPGQQIEEHAAPSSPLTVIGIKGHGYFTDLNGKETPIGPNSLLYFGADEPHAVRASDDEELIFVGVLQGVPGTRPDHQGGELGRED